MNEFTGPTAYQLGSGPLLCDCCGRVLSNDPAAENAALWSLARIRLPYCADSDLCRRDVTGRAS